MTVAIPGGEGSAADMVAARQAQFLRTLSHEHRLLILVILRSGERSVGEIEAILNVPQPAVSQQLARLRQDDFVAIRRSGRLIYYSLNHVRLEQLFSQFEALFPGFVFREAPDAGASGPER